MPGDSDYLPAGLRQAAPAWGRRSRFEIEGKALMVSEVFLEAFVPWSSPLPVHRSQRGKVSATTTPSVAAGTCQVMMRLHSRYRPPTP